MQRIFEQSSKIAYIMPPIPPMPPVKRLLANVHKQKNHGHSESKRATQVPPLELYLGMLSTCFLALRQAQDEENV